MKIADVEAKLDAWGIEVEMIRAPIVALVERVVQAEADRDRLRNTIRLMREGGMELPASLFREIDTWEPSP
jgi:hypothetical protein